MLPLAALASLVFAHQLACAAVVPADTLPLARRGQLSSFCSRFEVACQSTCLTGKSGSVSLKYGCETDKQGTGYLFTCQCNDKEKTSSALNKMAGKAASTIPASTVTSINTSSNFVTSTWTTTDGTVTSTESQTVTVANGDSSTTTSTILRPSVTTTLTLLAPTGRIRWENTDGSTRGYLASAVQPTSEYAILPETDLDMNGNEYKIHRFALILPPTTSGDSVNGYGLFDLDAQTYVRYLRRGADATPEEIYPTNSKCYYTDFIQTFYTPTTSLSGTYSGYLFRLNGLSTNKANSAYAQQYSLKSYWLLTNGQRVDAQLGAIFADDYYGERQWVGLISSPGATCGGNEWAALNVFLEPLS